MGARGRVSGKRADWVHSGLFPGRAVLWPSDFAREGPVLDLLSPALHLEGGGGRQVRQLSLAQPSPPSLPIRPAGAPLPAHPAHGAQRVEHAEVIIAGMRALPAAVHILHAAVVVCRAGWAVGVVSSQARPWQAQSWAKPRLSALGVSPSRLGPAPALPRRFHPRLITSLLTQSSLTNDQASPVRERSHFPSGQTPSLLH